MRKNTDLYEDNLLYKKWKLNIIFIFTSIGSLHSFNVSYYDIFDVHPVTSTQQAIKYHDISNLQLK